MHSENAILEHAAIMADNRPLRSIAHSKGKHREVVKNASRYAHSYPHCHFAEFEARNIIEEKGGLLVFSVYAEKTIF